MTNKAWALAALMVAALASGPSRAADAGGAPSPSTSEASATVHPDLVDVTWEWIWFGSGKEQFDVEKPDHYTIAFSVDGTLAIRADCNRGSGRY